MSLSPLPVLYKTQVERALGRQQDQTMKIRAKGVPQVHYPELFREDGAWRSHSSLSQPSPSVAASPQLFACQKPWLFHPQTLLPQPSAHFSCASGPPQASKSSYNVWWASLIVEFQTLVKKKFPVVMPGAPQHALLIRKERRES